MAVLKQRLSPLVIVVLIAVALMITAGVFYLAMHHRGPDASEAPPVVEDPYAGQITGGPAPSNPEPSVAP